MRTNRKIGRSAKRDRERTMYKMPMRMFVNKKEMTARGRENDQLGRTLVVIGDGYSRGCWVASQSTSLAKERDEHSVYVYVLVNIINFIVCQRECQPGRERKARPAKEKKKLVRSGGHNNKSDQRYLHSITIAEKRERNLLKKRKLIQTDHQLSFTSPNVDLLNAEQLQKNTK